MPSRFDQRLAVLDTAHEAEFADMVQIGGQSVPAIFEEYTAEFNGVNMQVCTLEILNSHIPERGFIPQSLVTLADGRRFYLGPSNRDTASTEYRLSDV